MRNEGWGGGGVELIRRMSRQRVLEELSAGPALLLAGSQYCLYARIRLSVHQATAPLSNRPVNNSMLKRIFSLNCNLECITK